MLNNNVKETAKGVSGLAVARPHSLAKKRRRKETVIGILFLVPAAAFLFTFIFFPTLLAFVLAFFHYQIGVPGMQWKGASYFTEAFSDSLFRRSLVNSFYYAGMAVPSILIIATLIALLINKASRYYTFIRTLVLFPYVTPAVGTAIGWMWIYNPTYGLANAVLTWLHLPTSQWLQSPYMALPSVVIYSIWHGVGFDIIILMAALNNLPKGVLEASLVDGATPWYRFWRITLPLISPTMFFLVIITTIGSLQSFSEVFALSGASGGPEHATTTTLFLIYQTAFNNGYFSYASAMAIILVVFILIFTLIQRWIGKYLVFYQ